MQRTIASVFFLLFYGMLFSQEKPNIIISDDQGWGDVGFNGATVDFTQEAVTFSSKNATPPFSL